MMFLLYRGLMSNAVMHFLHATGLPARQIHFESFLNFALFHRQVDRYAITEIEQGARTSEQQIAFQT